MYPSEGNEKQEREKKPCGRTTFSGKPEVSTRLAESCAGALSGFAWTVLSFECPRGTCPRHSRPLSQRDLSSESPRGGVPWPAYLSTRGTLEGRLSHPQSQLESSESRHPTGYGPTGIGSLSGCQSCPYFFQFSTALLCRDRRAKGRVLLQRTFSQVLACHFVCLCVYVCLVSMCVQPRIPRTQSSPA